MKVPTPNHVLTTALLVGLLTACSLSSPEPRLYLIEPMTASSAGTPTDEDLTVAVGSVDLPGHLEGKEIVTYDQRYSVSYAEFERWAEPLDENISSTLVENLSMLLPSSRVFADPANLANDPDFRVQVNVIAFGSDPSGDVILSTSWAIRDTDRAPVKLVKKRYSTARQGDDMLALVAAMSRAIEQLSRDIADALPDG